MHPGAPIPVSAFFYDPLWQSRFIDLASALVLMNAKPKIISRYTGLQSKAIASRYLRLNNTTAKKGRLKVATSKSFAAVHKRWGATGTSKLQRLPVSVSKPSDPLTSLLIGVGCLQLRTRPTCR